MSHAGPCRLLDEQYIRTEKVQMAFGQLPLEALHPNALRAASIPKCAGTHGKFWEAQRALFEAGGVIDDAALVRQALAVGLDGAIEMTTWTVNLPNQ